MRTYTQQELNDFIIYHITELCNDYKTAKKLNCNRNANYYFAQLMAYDNMAIVYADCDTYTRIHNAILKTLGMERVEK